MDIGDVTVDFQANAASFVADMDAMIESVKAFQDAVDSALVSVEALHAAIDDLPSDHVTNVTLTGEDDILEQVAEIREYLAGLPEHETIHVSMDTSGAPGAVLGGLGTGAGAEASAAAVNALTDALDRNAAAWSRVEDAGRDYSVMMGETIADANESSGALDRVFAVASDGVVSVDSATEAVRRFDEGLAQIGADGPVFTDAARAIAATVAPLDAAGAAATRAGGTFRAFGWLTANAIHWIIAGGAEILAVTVPAMVALGAGAAVALQGSVNMYEHLSAVYTATEATANVFHTTAGQVVGLGDALQQAQDAANPDVYSILGSAIITVNEHFGNLAQTGLQVVQMFQTFAAKVAVDFGPGGSMGTATTELLSHMTTDLQGIGQLFGNLGHGLLSLASQMPGLAEILLGSFAGIAGALSNVIQFAARFQVAGASIITVLMGFEEFNRWGGLLATTLTRLGLASASLTGGPFSFARMGSVIQGLLSVFPTLIAYVARFAATIGAGGIASGLTGFSEGLAGVIENLSPLQAGLIGVAAVGLGVLIDKLVTAQDVTQRFAASLQAATMKASNLQSFQTIAQNIAQLNSQLVQVTRTAPTVTNEFGRLGAIAPNVAGAMATNVNPAIAELNAGLRQQEQDLRNVSQGAQYLASTYHTSLVGAMALADAANVKLASGITGTSQAAEVARMQIASYVQGMQAMGAPLSAVGSDVEALAIQSGLASTQVSNLNQAWDQFMQNLTGGTADLAQLNTSLANLTTGTNNVTSVLGKTASISLSIQSFASSLKTFSGNGAQAWQNFDQVVGSTAPQLIDWMRTAGAEGALSGQQFTQGVLDMASSLVPLASKSQVAQTEVLGLVHQVAPSITTWGQLQAAIKNSGASLSGLNPIISGATQKMGDMSVVAQNLGTATQTALLSTLSAAKVMASGIGTAMQQYEQALMNGSSHTDSLKQSVILDFEKMGYTAQQAEQIINAAIAGITPSKTITITITTQNIETGATPVKGINPAAGGVAPHAAAGWHVPGWGGGDVHPALLEGGEAVVPKELVGPIAPYLGAHHVPGFQSGGIAGGWYDGGYFGGLASVLSGASGGSSGGGGSGGLPALELHLHGDLADKNLWEKGQIQTLKYNFRNSGKPTGAVKPS